MENIAIIIAGGSGTRLWPLSTQLKPKFLFPLTHSETILQKHIKSIYKCGFTKIIVVTSINYVEELKKHLNCLDLEIDFLCEPIQKNTAPSIIFAAKYIQKYYKNSLFMVFPADHIISDYSGIKKILNQFKRNQGKYPLISLAKLATNPSSKFGYLIGNKKTDGIFQTQKFVEKPSKDKLSSLLKSFSLYMNTGMFITSTDFFINELTKLNAKLVSNVLDALDDDARTLSYNKFSIVESISIDHALMEKTKTHAFCLLESNWEDLGSFASYSNHAQEMLSDDHGNYIKSSGDHLKDATNNFVWSSDKFVSILGLNNIMCVENDNNLLLADKKLLEDNDSFFEGVSNQFRKSRLADRFSVRPWGWYLTLEEDIGYKVKKISVFPGESLSLQSHTKREETWTVVDGIGEVQINEDIIQLKEGETVKIPINTKHRVKNTGNKNLVFIEVQMGPYLGEDDITRYEDVYKRR